MFESFDGTGLPPRQIQRDFLNFVEANWASPVIAGTLPCGSGKSYLAKSIMDQVSDTVYITANNVLVWKNAELKNNSSFGTKQPIRVVSERRSGHRGIVCVQQLNALCVIRSMFLAMVRGISWLVFIM